MYICGSGVADVRTDQRFRILVANLSHRTSDVLPNEVFATASAQPETLFESHLSHAEAFI